MKSWFLFNKQLIRTGIKNYYDKKAISYSEVPCFL